LGLGPPVVEDESHDLALTHREVLHFLMESGPPLHVVRRRGRGRGVEARAAVVGPRPYAVGVGALTLQAVVVPGQVKQLTPYLFGGEAEEHPRRVGADGLQGPEQPDQGVLQDVVVVGPAADLGIAMQHLSREELQPSVEAADELVARREVTAPHAGDPLDELGCLGGRIDHGSHSEHLDADVATNGLKRAWHNHLK
jgi:hypothetical protein